MPLHYFHILDWLWLKWIFNYVWYFFELFYHHNFFRNYNIFEYTVVLGFSVLGFRALPGFRALCIWNQIWIYVINLPGFSAFPGFKAPFHGDGQSALNPGTTVLRILFRRTFFLNGGFSFRGKETHPTLPGK